MKNKPSDALLRAAQRAAEQPFFLASVFAAYQQANRLDNADMAALLGCEPDDLTRLALCRRPAAEEGQFLADIDHLARRFRLQGDQLIMIIRQVDALAAIRQQLHISHSGTGMLRAARDHKEPDTPGEEGQHD